MNWNIPTWDAPEFVKVLAIAAAITAGIVATLVVLWHAFNIIFILFGETATVVSFFTFIAFSVIAGVTYMVRNI